MSPESTNKYESFAHLKKLLYLVFTFCLTWIVAIFAYYYELEKTAYILAVVASLLALVTVAICKASRQTVTVEGDYITVVLPKRFDKLVFAKQTYTFRVTTLLEVEIIDRKLGHVRIRNEHHELELKYFLQCEELVANINKKNHNKRPQ